MLGSIDFRVIVDFRVVADLSIQLGANCIQNFHLGRYIVGYKIGNIVLWRRPSVYRTIYLPSSNENFEYGYPILILFSMISLIEALQAA